MYANVLYIFQMSVFLQSLTHVPVGITVGGFFMVTKEAIITVNPFTYLWLWVKVL